MKIPDPVTNVSTLRQADWEGTEKEVVEKIRALRDLVQKMELNALNDRVCSEAIYPNLTLLGMFCTNVRILGPDFLAVDFTPKTPWPHQDN